MRTLIVLAATIAALALSGPPAHASTYPAYEWGGPTVQQARGVMVVIHGGSWFGSVDMMHGARDFAAFYQQQGWRTLNIDYRSGPTSIYDVVRFYELARKAVGSSVPVCAAGQSAGGNLAMMLAVLRPNLACVISEEGPANLMPLRDGHTIPSIAMTLRSWTAAQAQSLTVGSRLSAWRGKILATYSEADTYIPADEQIRSLHRGLAPIDVTMMPAGDVPFIHFSTTQDALDGWHRRQTVLLNQIGR